MMNRRLFLPALFALPGCTVLDQPFASDPAPTAPPPLKSAEELLRAVEPLLTAHVGPTAFFERRSIVVGEFQNSIVPGVIDHGVASGFDHTAFAVLNRIGPKFVPQREADYEASLARNAKGLPRPLIRVVGSLMEFTPNAAVVEQLRNVSLFGRGADWRDAVNRVASVAAITININGSGSFGLGLPGLSASEQLVYLRTNSTTKNQAVSIGAAAIAGGRNLRTASSDYAAIEFLFARSLVTLVARSVHMPLASLQSEFGFGNDEVMYGLAMMRLRETLGNPHAMQDLALVIHEARASLNGGVWPSNPLDLSAGVQAVVSNGHIDVDGGSGKRRRFELPAFLARASAWANPLEIEAAWLLAHAPREATPMDRLKARQQLLSIRVPTTGDRDNKDTKVAPAAGNGSPATSSKAPEVKKSKPRKSAPDRRQHQPTKP